MDKILFIGAGNMGQAIINGIIMKGIAEASNIYFFETNEKTRERVKEKYNIQPIYGIDKSISEFDIVILAVKPQVFKHFMEDEEMSKLADFIKKDQLIVSIMAGIKIDTIDHFFYKFPQVIRIMPNTPALVGEGMSVFALKHNVTNDSLEYVEQIFNSIGKTAVLEEYYLDAVTGLSGSGPAYVFMFVEALTQGGILNGLSKGTSEKLAIQTLKGAIKMLEQGDKKAEELRHAVSSPGGTTIHGLFALENRGFRAAVIDAVKSATDRSKEFGRE